MYSRSKLKTWLQLLRAPNLFTVPGDPLAGFLIATITGLKPSVLLPVGASLCFYCAGLLLNDLVDLDEDRRERPTRPLPSGAVAHAAVRNAAGALIILGSLLCLCGGAPAILTGFALVAAIVVYNFGGKRLPLLGPLSMGLCRGLSLLLGASYGTQLDLTAFTTAAALVFYIAAVTSLSRYETKLRAPLLAKWLPTLVLVAALVGFNFDVRVNHLTFSAFFLVAILAALGCSIRATKNATLPPIIGSFIRVLLPMQAAFCVGFGAVRNGLTVAVVLLVFWPLSFTLGKRFHAS